VSKWTSETGRLVSIGREYLSGHKRVEYSDEYYTPEWIPAAISGFDLDPCAGPIASHAKVNWRLPKEDGLVLPWFGCVWCNPPYSDLYKWLAKFTEHGNGVLCVNCRADTHWFQDLIANGDGLLVLRGRVQFISGKTSKRATVGTALVAYGSSARRRLFRSGLPGLRLTVG
jgi:hypothetical protein